MGLFGGGNSKTSQTTNITEANIQNNLAGGEYGGAVATTLANNTISGTVTLTDHASVSGALDLAGRALDSGGSLFDKALSSFSDNFKISQQRQSATIDAALELAKTSTQTESEKSQETIIWIVGLMIVGLVLASGALK